MIKFYKGDAEDYNQESHGNGIYFAHDTKEIFTDEKKAFGKNADLSVTTEEITIEGGPLATQAVKDAYPNSINRIIKVTDINGTVRELPRTNNTSFNRFASKIFIGEHLDFVCTNYGSTSTSGYCDVLAVSDNKNAVDGYVYRCYESSDKTGITCYRGDCFKGSYFRLAFYGNIIIVENPSDFILL